MITNGIADKPTEQLTFGQRVLGKLVRIDLGKRESDVVDVTGKPYEFDPDPANVAATTDLAADVFWNLYKSERTPVANVPAERRINESLINWMHETPGFEKSRGHSVGNLPASAMSAALLTHYLQSDEIMGELLRQQDEIDKLAHERENARAQSAMFNAAVDAALEQEATTGEPAAEFPNIADWREMADDDEARAQQLDQLIGQMVDAMEETIENAKSDPLTAAAMSAATRDAADAAADMAQVMAGFGLSGASDVKTDPNAAVEFAAMINDQIREIAELAGRVKGFAMRAYRERVQTGSVATQIGVTNRIDRLMPSELALLRPDAPAAIRGAKIAELVESGLLGYLPTGDGEKSGPFVFALDESGSMGDNNRLVVGRAVGLGLAMAARELGRKYVLFNFAAEPSAIRTITDGDDWRAHLEWASTGAGGGTDFDMAILHASTFLKSLGDDGNRADCVFASDGEGHVSDTTTKNWRKFVDTTGARLIYVPVDDESIEYMDSPYFNLGEIADMTLAVPRFDGDAAVELAANVAADWS